MTTASEWLALAERCEKATGPDREIDALIWQALYPDKLVMTDGGGYGPDKRPPTYVRASQLPVSKWESKTDLAILIGAEPVTASLDAITALIERELPGFIWSSTFSVGLSTAKLFKSGTDFIGFGSSEPLARCSAFCRAMAVKEGGHG